MRIRTRIPVDPPDITSMWSTGLTVDAYRSLFCSPEPTRIKLSEEHYRLRWRWYRRPRTRFALKWYKRTWIYKPPRGRRPVDYLAPSGALMLTNQSPKLIVHAPYMEEGSTRFGVRAICHILEYPAYAMYPM